MNTLYYGDNLEVLRLHIDPESVDLIYLDPPFKSDQNYNVLFADHGIQSAAQIQAFEDTWHWDQSAAGAYQEVVEMGGSVSQAMQAFRTFLGDNDMLAYLSMMAPRLIELRRVLKTTGSIYLHCDPAASHYLKMLMDAVFSPSNFRNEVIWKRTGAHGGAKRYGPVHDTILFYSQSDDFVWNSAYVAYDEDYIKKYFRNVDERGRHSDEALTGPGTRTGESGQPWGGCDPAEIGRHWQPASYAYEKYKELTKTDLADYPFLQRLDKLNEVGLIFWTDKGTPRLKRYLDDARGVPAPDMWSDIPPINSQAQERLGYPTQKPEALLQRIIAASSNEGDTVLDPFCGCGTAIAAAQSLNRQWIGIDLTHLAVTLIKHRLQSAFGNSLKFKVIGEPVDIGGAESLADSDPYQFQWWALGLVGARPVDQKKGADKGIDGRLYFHDEAESGKTKQIIFSVKAGKTGSSHVRDLRGVIEREKAAIGVLLTMQDPTKAMRTEAAGAGFYDSPWGTKHPRLQILTVEELLEGKKPDFPPSRDVRTFKSAPKVKRKSKDKQKEMFGDDEPKTPW